MKQGIRHLAATSLVAFLSLLLLPLASPAFAETNNDKDLSGSYSESELLESLMCSRQIPSVIQDYEAPSENDDENASFNNFDAAKNAIAGLEERLSEQSVELVKASNKDGYEPQYCGIKANPKTGFLEKRDCTDEGLVITELVEPVGPTTNLDDGENRIINVFKGTCCFIAEQQSEGGDYQCTETRDIYTLTYQECTENAAYCTPRQWIVGSSGAGILKVFVKQIYIFGAGLVGSVAVVTLVVSGIQISVSGVAGDISNAKQRIFQAIAGIALLFFSGIILYTINPTFFS